jgi:hypothetical protein
VQRVIFGFCTWVFIVGLGANSIEAKPLSARCVDFLKRFNKGETETRDALEQKFTAGMGRWFTHYNRLPTIPEFAKFMQVPVASLKGYASTYRNGIETILAVSLQLAPYKFDGVREKMAKAYAKISKEIEAEILKHVKQGEMSEKIVVGEEEEE